ncbi:MAG: P-loop NTPase [Actinobacteria bacterium]|nr:P-loop NTPase [Actinomycetota bacterium]
MSAVENPVTFAVAIVEADAHRRQSLVRQLGDDLGTASFASLRALEAQLNPDASAVVVLGPSCAPATELEQVGWMARTWPDVGVILVVEELSTTVLQQAMRAGVRDVLATPDRAQLTWAVAQVADTLTGATGPPTTLAPPSGDAVGELTTVFSTKGGSGTSVVATNLAVTLARRSSGTVALVDADLQFGDVAVMLETRLEHTIADAATAGERLDAPLLRSLMVRHDPSGLLVLPAPVEPALAEKISADDIRRIVEVLRSFCDHIVVDTASRFDDVALALLDQSDGIILVSGMEVPGVKNLKLGVQTLRLLDTPASKLKLVLVRSNAKVQMEVRDIERALALKADVVVPNDSVVPESLNRCVPVVIGAPRSPVARAFEALGDAFLPGVEPVKRRRTMFSRRG